MMNKRWVLVLIAIILGVVFPVKIQATYGINRTINFQGKLVNASGVNVANATPVTATFSIYQTNSSCPGGGAAVWSENQTFTPVDGIFQVALGSSTVFGTSIDFSQDTLYLGMKISTEANEMCSGSSRIRLAAVPQAFNAEKFAGLSADNNQTNYFTITGGQGTPANLKVDGDITVGPIITPTSAGGLTVQSNGANNLVLDTGSAAALNIGITSSNLITLGRSGTVNTSGSIVKLPGGLIAQGNVIGKALVILDETGDQDILAASQSGVSVFSLHRVSGTAANGMQFTPATTNNSPILTAFGSDTNVGLTINTKATGALTLDSGTTGIINLGTGISGKTINIGTDNTNSDTINIGSSLDHVAITGDQWSVTNDGLLTIRSCIGCGTNPQTVRRLGANYTNATLNFSTITDGTDNDDQDLTFETGVNETWTFEAVIYISSPALADMKFQVTGPTNVNCKIGFENSEDTVNVSNIACGATSGQLNSDAAYNVVRVNGTIITDGNNGGKVSVQFGQFGGPNGISTIQAGSYIIATQVLGATGGQPITLTGDVTGTGNGTVNTTVGPNKILSGMILDGTIAGGDLATNIAISTTGAYSGPTTVNTINNLIINGSTQTMSANSILDSGALTVSSAANTLLTLQSANNAGGASGGVTVTSGTGTTSTGIVNIDSGNASAGTAGNITMDVGTSTAGNGSILVGTAAWAQTISLGTATAGINSTVNINNITNGGTIAMGGGLTTGSITIGGASMAAGSTTIYGGTNVATAIALTPGTAGGITIGAAAGTGNILLGSSSATQTVNIGTGTAAANNQTVNIGTSTTGGAGIITVNIGNTNTGTNGVTAVNIKAGNAGGTSAGPRVTLGATASTTAVCSSLGLSPAVPTAGTTYELRDCSGAPAQDYAEMYPVKTGVEYGDVAATSNEIVEYMADDGYGNVLPDAPKRHVARLIKADKPYQSNVIGIVSLNYADFSSTGHNVISKADNPMPIALNGRVPVKISSLSDPIAIGDFLTTSNDPGKAVKAAGAGFVIGKALENWQPGSSVNKIMVFVAQGYTNGLTDINVSTGLLGANTQLVQTINMADKVSLPEMVSDRIIAGLEMVTPKLTADKVFAKDIIISGSATISGGITADWVKANRIEGLEVLAKKFSGLEDKIASMSAGLTITPSPWPSPTITPTLGLDMKVLGDLIANKSISVNGPAVFGDNVVFKGPVTFQGVSIFGKDTAGFAVIKKDTVRVDIVFVKEYSDQPIVSVNIAMDLLKNTDGSANDTDNNNLENQILQENYAFIITRKTNKGFTIVLNKNAKQDLAFSWTVVAVKSPQTFTSVIPLPTPLSAPVITPVVTTVPASDSGLLRAVDLGG